MRKVMVVVGPMALLLAACGGSMEGMDHGGESTSVVAPRDSDRVNVVMRDLQFAPDKVGVKKGSTVTFIFSTLR